MAKKKANPKTDDLSESGVFSAGDLADVDFDAESEEFSPQAEASPVAGESVVPDDLLDAKQKLLEAIGLYESDDGDLDFTAHRGVISQASPWAGRSNIVGVGVGPELKEGKFTGRDAVAVYVIQKLGEEAVVKDLRIPKTIGGRPTDVIATGEFTPFSGLDFRYTRPVPCGVSIGRMGSGSVGTLGALVVGKDFTPYILSNNHVIGDQSTNNHQELRIVQSGVKRGTANLDPKDVIAVKPKWVEFQFGSGNVNFVDAAIAETRVTSADGKTPVVRPEMLAWNPERIFRLGPDYEFPRPDQAVQKTGRTTGTTVGAVFHTNVDQVPIRYKGGTAVFNDQASIRSTTSNVFSAAGDSGSLVVTRSGGVPVGLLFAGSPQYTLINPMPTVMKILKQKFGVVGILREVV